MQTIKIEITFADVKLTSEDVESYIAGIIDDNIEIYDEVLKCDYYINNQPQEIKNEEN